MADLRWWVYDTPVGELTVLVGDAGLRRLVFPGEDLEAVLDGDAQPERDDEVAGELEEYFGGRRRRFGVPVDLRDVRSEFHRRVLETLWSEVPYGHTITYGELAALTGSPGAARAVGAAMRTNPVPIVVPCHRVVPAGGGVGGYGGHPERKAFLLALEGVQLG